MKTKLLLFFWLTTFISCSVQEKSTSTSSTQTLVAPKGNMMYGKFIVKSNRAGDINSASEKPEYYFQYKGEDYFIQWNESKITKDMIQGKMFKELDVRGELIAGVAKTSEYKTRSDEAAPERTDIYIVIYEIIE